MDYWSQWIQHLYTIVSICPAEQEGCVEKKVPIIPQSISLCLNDELLLKTGDISGEA